MKSFLKRKRAQVIAALVIAIAVWTTIVGLGLSNGIARAASVFDVTVSSVTINNQAQLSQGSIDVTIKWRCPISRPVTGPGNLVGFAFTVTQGTTIGQARFGGNRCAGREVISTFPIAPFSGAFTLGQATVAASMSGVSAAVGDTRTVRIVS